MIMAMQKIQAVYMILFQIILVVVTRNQDQQEHQPHMTGSSNGIAG
jgi:hypothetical protein